MVSLTRREFLHRTALGASIASTSGCTAPNLGGPGGGAAVPKPFTNSAYTASYTTEGRWSMEGHDGGRTGRADTAVPQGDVGEAWLRRPGTEPHGATAPVVGPDRVYVGYEESPDGTDAPEAYLVGVDAETGDQRLDVHLGTGRVVGLALADGRLLVVTRGAEYDEATLRSLTRESGAVQWAETMPDVTGPPAVVDGACYLATRDDDNAVYAYSLDGSRRWRTAVDGECYTATCADSDGVYVGLADGRIVALESTGGRQRWAELVVTPDGCCPDIQGTPTVSDGRLYVPGISEELVAVDTTDGTVDWRASVVDDDYGNPVPSPAVSDDTVYVNTNHGGVVALAVADGSVRWRSSGEGDVQPPAVGDGVVVVPRHDSVVAYDGADDRAWTVDITVPDIGMAGYVMDTEVALAHGMCYVGVADGRVYAIGARE